MKNLCKTFSYQIILLLLVLVVSCNQPEQPIDRLPHESEMEGLMYQEFYMTKDPALGYVPAERKLEAARQTLQMLATMRTENFSWQERGPNNIAGRVRAVLIDKRDITGNTIISAGVSGGLWKCTNFKSNPVWTLVTDNLPNNAITCIAQDPSNLNIMYAGTGEGWFNIGSVRGNGILKSTNGGDTWSFLPSTQTSSRNFDYVQDIEVTANGVIYAATRSSVFCNSGGVLKSVDGGNNWAQSIGTPSGTCSGAFNYRGADLEIAANGDIYATTGFRSTETQNVGRIWKSPASLGASQGNFGNWTEITPAGTWQRIEVAVAPSNPNVVYALLQAGSNNAIGGLRRSDNGGATWTTLTMPLWCDQGTTSTDFTRTQAWYDLIASVDPNNPLICYIGGVDILKTTDGGTSWAQVTQWAGGCSNLPNIHADQHEILFFGNSSTEILAATDGGIYYTSNAGASWLGRNNNFNITQFYSIDHHPVRANYFLGGTQDNGTLRLSSAGIISAIPVIGGDGGVAHIDQTDNGLLQVGALPGNNYRYSRNDGISWSIVSGGSSTIGRFINPTDFDDVNNVLYGAHNFDRMSVITGLAGTGTPIVNAVTVNALSGRQISAVKVDPNVLGSGTVWIAGSTDDDATANVTPVIIKLTNAHTLSPVVVSTFTFPTNLLPVGAYISCIDVEEGNANHIVISVSNYGVSSVLESVNGGTSWSVIEGNLPDMPVRWVIIAPNHSLLNGPSGGTGGLIAGTEMGVWTTSQTTGNRVWIPNNTQFPVTRVDMLKYRSLDNLLSAGTHGRGLFTTTIPSIATAINPVINTTGFIEYVSADKQQLFIKTGKLPGMKTITINIIDAQGRLVLTRKGNYTPHMLNINTLGNGMYIVKVFGDNKASFTQQVIK